MQVDEEAVTVGEALAAVEARRLRDLIEPERVWQVVHPELPSVFAPVRGDALSARAWPLAAALLLLGLLLEPLQGGIRKDPSTFSYQVVCAGLSLLLVARDAQRLQVVLCGLVVFDGG